MKALSHATCLAALLLSSTGIAQTTHRSGGSLAAGVRGGFAAIVVSDLEASVRWYELNLGLHEIRRGKSPRLPAETVILGGPAFFVELIHHDGEQLPRIDDEASVSRVLKAGGFLEREQFDTLAAYFIKQGVLAGVYEDKDTGLRSFQIRDNERNLIQFFTPTTNRL
jgi:catechol 2,3-dioxygenase-like lactoylglutathione lyase family enzyme